MEGRQKYLFSLYSGLVRASGAGGIGCRAKNGCSTPAKTKTIDRLRKTTTMAMNLRRCVTLSTFSASHSFKPEFSYQKHRNAYLKKMKFENGLQMMILAFLNGSSPYSALRTTCNIYSPSRAWQIKRIQLSLNSGIVLMCSKPQQGRSLFRAVTSFQGAALLPTSE